MIKRLIINVLRNEINQPHINILLGARQVGKTTILKTLENIARQQGLTTSFFDLEQPSVLAKLNQSEEHLIALIGQSAQVVFIDEFQYLKNASKIFKAIFDGDLKTKIFCSGSSALEIHKHLKESLAGRRFIFRIYPLQWQEIKKMPHPMSFDDYILYGGMPALTQDMTHQRKQAILEELLSAYILKDVKALIKEENIRAFNHLIYLLAQQQGSTISTESLAREIGLSPKAISRYLDILEATYVNSRLHSYSTNLGNELKKSCKTYLYDTGIRNSILKDFSVLKDRQDKGVLLESFVFLKLKTILAPNMDIKFWRTKEGHEVDFILLVNRKPWPIEVKSKLSNPEIPSGLKRFLARYPRTKQAYIVNENLSQRVEFKSCAIRFITFQEFADLNQDSFDL